MKLTILFPILSLTLPLAVRAVDQTGAEAFKKPVSATVVDREKVENYDIGNIEVTYLDGTKDRWTTKGGAGDPRVAPDGTVGWTLYGPEVQIGTSFTLRPNGNLVICRAGKVLCRVEAGRLLIEEWGFEDGGEKFVLKTRGPRGPADVELHDTKTGELLATVEAFKEDLPRWAVPYRE